MLTSCDCLLDCLIDLFLFFWCLAKEVEGMAVSLAPLEHKRVPRGHSQKSVSVVEIRQMRLSQRHGRAHHAKAIRAILLSELGRPIGLQHQKQIVKQNVQTSALFPFPQHNIGRTTKYSIFFFKNILDRQKRLFSPSIVINDGDFEAKDLVVERS